MLVRSLNLPDIYSFFSFGNNFISTTGVTTPSNIPNSVSSPTVISMRKNMTAHSCAKGILLIASVNTIKANPWPDGI